MVSLSVSYTNGILVAFGGWNSENSASLANLEVWNPNSKTWWINGTNDVFQTGRQKFGMVTLSFPPGTCEISIESNRNIQDWATYVLDNVINP